MSNSPASSLGASGSMFASAIVAKAASGSHVLKIDGYSRTTRLGEGKFITSRSLEIGGHRWCLQYYPDGFNSYSAGFISILLCLAPGQAGGVRTLYKISLLDKEGNPVPGHVCESDTCVTFGHPQGAHRFIRKEELKNPLYLKDDAFSLKCDITVVSGIITEDAVIPTVGRGIKKESHV